MGIESKAQKILQKRLRMSIARILERQKVSELVLHLEMAGGNVRSFDHLELRQAVMHVLRDQDLRQDAVTMGRLKDSLCAWLKVTREEFSAGLRLADSRDVPGSGEGFWTTFVRSVYLELYDVAWQLFLFDDGPDPGGCCARKQNGRPECAVLYRCGADVSVLAAETRCGVDLCAAHAKDETKRRAGLRLGVWGGLQQNIWGLAATTQDAIVRRARDRATRRPTETPENRLRVLGHRGFNAARTHGRAAGRQRAVRQRGQQPSFAPTVPGQLRCFEEEASALPAFPCRLCACDFSHRQALWTHIKCQHVSVAE